MAGAHQTQRQLIDCRGVALEWGGPCRALVMGILNVTPDSFFDGGLYVEVGAAVEQVGRMLEDGADLIDIGGESTRPAGAAYGAGASVVSEVDELERVVPVVEAVMHAFPDCIVSVDTYKSRVAEAALDAGARMVNDITAFRADPELADVVARFGVPVVLMHSVGLPGEMPHTLDHDDVVWEVKTELEEAVAQAEQCGIKDVIIDPGFGFGKSVADNLRLIGQLQRFTDTGKPVLVGVSRKSTIGAALSRGRTPKPVEERLFGSLAATSIAVAKGASIVRTHDVRPTRDVVETIHAVNQANAESPQAVS